MELLGQVFGFFLTMLILLYAFGDNALFRLALHIFIGAAAGMAGALAVRDVLLPELNAVLASGNPLDIVIPLLGVGLILMKLSPRTAALGNPASALLVGVGAALAIGGAIQGTLIPQTAAPSVYFNTQTSGFGTFLSTLWNGGVILIGTIATLVYFHFGARSLPNQLPKRNRLIDWIAKVGHVFIALAFGVIFAGVYSAALAALIERFQAIIAFIDVLLANFAG